VLRLQCGAFGHTILRERFIRCAADYTPEDRSNIEHICVLQIDHTPDLEALARIPDFGMIYRLIDSDFDCHHREGSGGKLLKTGYDEFTIG
jgi:hypothetical protein